jgi:hypothetical protein
MVRQNVRAEGAKCDANGAEHGADGDPASGK